MGLRHIWHELNMMTIALRTQLSSAVEGCGNLSGELFDSGRLFGELVCFGFSDVDVGLMIEITYFGKYNRITRNLQSGKWEC